MTENEFDELWQRAEAESYGQRLAAEYPAWRRKQTRIITVVTSLVLVVAVDRMARSDFLNGRCPKYRFIGSFHWLTSNDEIFEIEDDNDGSSDSN